MTAEEIKARLAEIEEELSRIQPTTVPYSVYLSAREVADYVCDGDMPPVVEDFVRTAQDVVHEYEYPAKKEAMLQEEYDRLYEQLSKTG